MSIGNVKAAATCRFDQSPLKIGLALGGRMGYNGQEHCAGVMEW